jgi:hypothetical protein
MNTIIPRGQQTVEDLRPRITDSKLSLLLAIEAGNVIWHYPPTTDRPHTTVRAGRASRVVTGETNWMRSHGLAILDREPPGSKAEHRRVILTPKGAELLEALRANTNSKRN